MALHERWLSPAIIKQRRHTLNSANFRSEADLALLIREAGLGRSRRNYPVLDSYFGDFVFVERKIIIEADGGYHRSTNQMLKDRKRDERLRIHGWRVFRFAHPFQPDVLDRLKKLKPLIQSKKQPVWTFSRPR